MLARDICQCQTLAQCGQCRRLITVPDQPLGEERQTIRQKESASEPGVRRDKAAFSSGCKPHPATAPAGSNRSSHGGNEVAEAFD